MSGSNSKLYRSLIISLLLSLAVGVFVFFCFSLGLSNFFSRTEVYLKNMNADYKVNEDGSMDVVETWETVFTGSDYSAGSKVLDVSQHGEEYELKSIRDLTNNKDYKLDASAREYDEGYCKQFMQGGRTYFEWYDDFGDETRTFEITYTVKNAVRLYNDTAELYWQFVGSDFELSIDNAVCTVTMPENAISPNNKIYGHLERSGAGETNAQFNDAGTAIFRVKDLPAKTYAELRLLMDREGFNGGFIINSDGYNAAVEEEEMCIRDSYSILPGY